MIKYAAAAILVLVPMLWGTIMVSVLNCIENLFFKLEKNQDSNND